MSDPNQHIPLGGGFPMVKLRAIYVMTLAAPLLAVAALIAPPASAGTQVEKTMIRMPGKANAATVGVSYRVEGKPAAGAETVVVIELKPARDAGPATVRFSADSGLILQNAPLGEIALQADDATTFRLIVVPQADGLRYLNIFTSQGGAVASSSIAIQAGKLPQPRAAGQRKTAPDGELLLSHPVK